MCSETVSYLKLFLKIKLNNTKIVHSHDQKYFSKRHSSTRADVRVL